MPLMSKNSAERIFIFENSFYHDGKKYNERFFYLIDDVKVDELNRPIFIKIKKILFIKSYIKKYFEVFYEIKLTNNIPSQIIESAIE